MQTRNADLQQQQQQYFIDKQHLDSQQTLLSTAQRTYDMDQAKLVKFKEALKVERAEIKNEKSNISNEWTKINREKEELRMNQDKFHRDQLKHQHEYELFKLEKANWKQGQENGGHNAKNDMTVNDPLYHVHALTRELIRENQLCQSRRHSSSGQQGQDCDSCTVTSGKVAAQQSSSKPVAPCTLCPQLQQQLDSLRTQYSDQEHTFFTREQELMNEIKERREEQMEYEKNKVVVKQAEQLVKKTNKYKQTIITLLSTIETMKKQMEHNSSPARVTRVQQEFADEGNSQPDTQQAKPLKTVSPMMPSTLSQATAALPAPVSSVHHSALMSQTPFRSANELDFLDETQAVTTSPSTASVCAGTQFNSADQANKCTVTCVHKTQQQELQVRFEQLQVRLTESQQKCEQLSSIESQYHALQSTHQQLQRQYDLLLADYSALQQQQARHVCPTETITATMLKEREDLLNFKIQDLAHKEHRLEEQQLKLSQLYKDFEYEKHVELSNIQQQQQQQVQAHETVLKQQAAEYKSIEAQCARFHDQHQQLLSDKVELEQHQLQLNKEREELEEKKKKMHEYFTEETGRLRDAQDKLSRDLQEFTSKRQLVETDRKELLADKERLALAGELERQEMQRLRERLNAKEMELEQARQKVLQCSTFCACM